MAEHAVIIAFLRHDPEQIFDLEEALEGLVASGNLGELDGNELAADGSDGTISLYGPDADALWAGIEATVRAAPVMAGATVELRYGPPGTRSQRVVLPLS